METKHPTLDRDCSGKPVTMLTDIRQWGIESDADGEPVKRKVCISASSICNSDGSHTIALLSFGRKP